MGEDHFVIPIILVQVHGVQSPPYIRPLIVDSLHAKPKHICNVSTSFGLFCGQGGNPFNMQYSSCLLTLIKLALM